MLDNAIKYSHKQGAIGITLRSDDSNVVLTVEDNGIGIPAEDLPHVFERFYRSTNTRTEKNAANGYGLGLPLAQEIVSAHGGVIHIQSRENEGTTVSITLPLAEH